LDISFSPEEEAFRAEVRAFIAEAKPLLPLGLGAPEAATRTRDDYMAWHKLLYKKGWAAPHWPKQYGGTGWSAIQRYIFNEECAAAEMPPLVIFGLYMLAPVLYTFGSDEQKEKFLRAFVRARIGGARAIPSRARVPTLPACVCALCARATTTSSTARRPGPRWPNMRTGFSALCAPTPTSSRRTASASCSST